MVVTTSVRAPSWHDNVHAYALTCFVPYWLHKFRLTLLFSYLWLWNISVLTSYYFLSADYVCIQLLHLFSCFLCLHALERLFCTIFICLHVVSCPVSFCIHDGLDYFYSSFHAGLDLFLVWTNLTTFEQYPHNTMF